jgi:leader peptidase (prepilin peptidase) / N-methyltransferase
MNVVCIAVWGLIGLGVSAVLLTIVRRSADIMKSTERLAPPAVLEMAVAGLFVTLAWRVGAKPELVCYSWFTAASVVLAGIDWKTHRLPTKLIWLSGIVLFVLFAVAASIDRDPSSLLRAAAGMVVLVTFYGAIYVSFPGQLGGGDVRLGGLLGLALGWAGWPALGGGTLLGWIAAAVTVLVLRVVRRPDPDRHVPIGPFLIVGAFVAVLMGTGN